MPPTLPCNVSPYSSRCETSTGMCLGGHVPPLSGINSPVGRCRAQPFGVGQRAGPGRVQEQVWGGKSSRGKKLLGARVKPSVV